jgi:Holliday junction resolvase RusA-like endonuclease
VVDAEQSTTAVAFFVSGHAQTQGSKIPVHRWGPMVGGKSMCSFFMREARGDRLEEWRALVATAAKRAMRQEMPFTGPVKVTLTFFFDRPASHMRAQRLVPWAFAKGKDDADKLARACLDAMTSAAVFEDDAQVADLRALKHYADVAAGERAGVRIEVITLGASLPLLPEDE